MRYDDRVEEVFQSEMQRQESERVAAQSLWDLVKHRLNRQGLFEVAEKFPQFAKEAKSLAAERKIIEERDSRSSMSFEDDMRMIGNDRL